MKHFRSKMPLMLALLLFGVSIAIALLAWSFYTPEVAHISNVPYVFCNSYYVKTAATTCPAYYLYQSVAEISEGLLVASALTLAFHMRGRLTVPDWLNIPDSLYSVAVGVNENGFYSYRSHSRNAPVGLSSPLRVVIILVGVVAFGVFLWVESFNILYANTGYGLYINLFHAFPDPPVSAILGLATASICFGLLRMKDGFSHGHKSGLMFGAIFVFVAQLCLLAFDVKEMTLYATGFSADWSLFNLPVLSNWLLLVVSSYLTFFTALMRSQP
jgi:hypothetical protein